MATHLASSRTAPHEERGRRAHSRELAAPDPGIGRSGLRTPASISVRETVRENGWMLMEAAKGRERERGRRGVRAGGAEERTWSGDGCAGGMGVCSAREEAQAMAMEAEPDQQRVCNTTPMPSHTNCSERTATGLWSPRRDMAGATRALGGRKAHL